MKPATSPKIMIVDDSLMDRMLLKHSIENFKYAGEVSCYENPLEAIHLLQHSIAKKDCNNIPELIFLDLNMPEMNGYNFLDLFMSFPKEVLTKCKIIILTSSDEVSDIEKSAKYSIVIDFMVKPIDKINVFVRETLTKLKAS